ncbi:hypothetical protein KIW84_057539 [Lathyrus oleraceus]|uniref:Uncharacterized protein n=1 Tax=Pisum sativum TaxID=3888 RepID=A0A9D5AP02_PEA|nr:hypothetical protein KIW84_057539 [Pisum sativum]KAI5412955.1 hypothetical protein KIW84_057539 [Pisum sativum]
MDHYQGLTKSFNHGKIYCSFVTARLVNMNLGISYDKLHILPLNQKIEIAGIGVTCLDANHCPSSIIILFQPLNGQVVLHTAVQLEKKGYSWRLHVHFAKRFT